MSVAPFVSVATLLTVLEGVPYPQPEDADCCTAQQVVVNVRLTDIDLHCTNDDFSRCPEDSRTRALTGLRVLLQFVYFDVLMIRALHFAR